MRAKDTSAILRRTRHSWSSDVGRFMRRSRNLSLSHAGQRNTVRRLCSLVRTTRLRFGPRLSRVTPSVISARPRSHVFPRDLGKLFEAATSARQPWLAQRSIDP